MGKAIVFLKMTAAMAALLVVSAGLHLAGHTGWALLAAGGRWR
jgi:hypothetical protein